MTKNLYLIRHGDIGSQGRYVGSSDLSLTSLGNQQITNLSKMFDEMAVDMVFCSPLRRCRQSLELLALSAPVTVSEELREVDFGNWEGRSFSEIVAIDEASVSAWAAGVGDFAFPGGERLSAFHDRVVSFWQRLREEEGKNLVVVTHGGVIRHLLCLALSLPLDKYLLFDIHLGSCASIALHSGGGVLTGMNLKR